MTDDETIKVALPEIPGFERYEVGDTTILNNLYLLTASGLQDLHDRVPFTVGKLSALWYRRVPENPPLPTREDCEKWGYEFPTVCDVPTKDNCDAWVASSGTVFSTINRNPNPGPGFESRRWLLRKKQTPLSFETWQGPLGVKVKRKRDGKIGSLYAYPGSVAVCIGSPLMPSFIMYAEADRDYETLDGKEIGRG